MANQFNTESFSVFYYLQENKRKNKNSSTLQFRCVILNTKYSNNVHEVNVIQWSPFSNSASSCAGACSRSFWTVRVFSMSFCDSDVTMIAPNASQTTLIVVRKRSLKYKSVNKEARIFSSESSFVIPTKSFKNKQNNHGPRPQQYRYRINVY